MITLVNGRGELLQFERDIERLAISEPKIADAVLVSPREVMVNGHAPGKASLVVWDGGSAPNRYNIDVSPTIARPRRRTRNCRPASRRA